MKNTYCLIYNPKAGTKRSKVPFANQITLEEVKALLKQYEIPVDYFPTKRAGHATELARDAIKEGYKAVLVAGGDGTVGEVANALVGTNTTLGILPLGTYMNTARMLAVQNNLELAVATIKMQRIRKIDVGCMTRLDGEKLDKPSYFLESAGLGLEADFHEKFIKLERGEISALFQLIDKFLKFYTRKITIELDDKKIVTRPIFVNIANGPYSGAALPFAPRARLNDHRLTISVFKMGRVETIRMLWALLWGNPITKYGIETHKSKIVKVTSKNPLPIHIDARVFGTTPATFKIIPSAIKVITGYPKDGDSSLLEGTYLDL